MLIIVSSTTLAGILSSAFVKDLVSFYATRLIGFLRPSIMAIARSLRKKLVLVPFRNVKSSSNNKNNEFLLFSLSLQWLKVSMDQMK